MSAPYGTHCTHCGVKHADDADWPRTCVNGHTMWNSVPTVAVALVPIAMPLNPNELYGSAMRNRSYGLVGVRRGIEPNRGSITLPGGFINYPSKAKPDGETWQEAVVRELKEESSDLIDIPASEVEEWMVRSSSNGQHCLIFGIVKERSADWFEDMRVQFSALEPNEETLELVLITGVGTSDKRLGFPTHQEAAEHFFLTLKSRVLKQRSV